MNKTVIVDENGDQKRMNHWPARMMGGSCMQNACHCPLGSLKLPENKQKFGVSENAKEWTKVQHDEKKLQTSMTPWGDQL